MEERDAEAVAGRLRSTFPRTQSGLHPVFEAREERVIFFWKDDLVRWQTEPFSPSKPAPKESAEARADRQQAITQPEVPKASRPKSPLIFAEYEAEAELRITDLMRSVFQSNSKSRLDIRESGSSFRGNNLARVASGPLKAGGKYETLSAQDREILAEVHRLLEKAYSFFDFGTLQDFQERLGVKGSRVISLSSKNTIGTPKKREEFLSYPWIECRRVPRGLRSSQSPITFESSSSEPLSVSTVKS
jgi:hypothetical protein